MRFLFDGGTLMQEQTARIVLQESELSAHAFVSPDEALDKLNPILSCCVRHALTAEQTGETFYLENQELV